MLILLTGKSNHDYIYNLTDHSIFTQLLASLEKLMITLRQKKQVATNLRKKAERQLQQVRSIERRSSSGLNSIDRKIESEKEDVTDVSGVLNQKTSQLESIERLVTAAHEHLNHEKEALGEAEQELEFAKNVEEEQSAKSRLNIIHDRIQELEFEIKNREKTAKKISEDVAKYNEIKSKISTTIQKQSKSKPTLRETMSTSHKAAEKFVRELEQKTRSEEFAAKALEKASSNLQALLAKKRKVVKSKTPSKKATRKKSKTPSKKATRKKSKTPSKKATRKKSKTPKKSRK